MKSALAILMLSMVMLGLLASGISCTKTVYMTATPTPTPMPTSTHTPTPSPTPTPAPTLTLTPSGDFVTVDDFQRGVSYVLPRNWNMASQDDLNQTPTLLPSAWLGEAKHEYAMIYVTTVPTMAGLSLEQILARRELQMQIGQNVDYSQPNPFAVRSVVVDKYSGFRLDYALKLDYASARAIEVWFMRGDLVFQVFAFATVDKFPDYESIFENVISSFKLTSGG